MKRLTFILIVYFIFSFAPEINAENSANETYKVGINDVLEIKVLDNNTLDTLATVSSDGTITFPYIGTVVVKGLKISEIKEEITRKLKEGYISYPVVTVSLIKSMIRKIYSYGELNSSGEIPYDDNDMTLIKAISLAGGISAQGLYGKIEVRRKLTSDGKYKDLLETDLDNGFINNQKIEETLLKPDDILIVGRNKTYLIQGEVLNRGRLVLEKNITVLKGLLQAGGVTKDGLNGVIKVRRKQEGVSGGYKDIGDSKIRDGVIETKEVENMLLQPDDILVVERNNTFLIQGEVANRGRFMLEKDMTVLRALLQAGGVTKDGLYGMIKVRRKQDEIAGGYQDLVESNLNDGVIENKEVENMLLQPDDILIVERNKTFLIQGEVTNRGRFILEKDMKVLRALLETGGVTTDGLYGKIKVRRKQEGVAGGYQDLVESNLSEGVIENKEVENMLLQPDDILIVERNKTFLIYGEVTRTGEFVLKNNMTVFKAITIAGGFTKFGSASRVKILRPKNDNAGFESLKVNIDDVIGGKASADILLEPGDTIVVSTGIF